MPTAARGLQHQIRRRCGLPSRGPPTDAVVPDEDRAKLTYTEQYAFLDGIDNPADREGGAIWLLDNLGKYLAS